MLKCEYKTSYSWIITGNEPYECPYTALKRPDNDGKKYCIFHNGQEDKDVEKFYSEFKKIYKKGEHNFHKFIFPKGFNFRRLRKETGPLKFVNSNFYGVDFLCDVDLSTTKFLGNHGTNFRWVKFLGEGMSLFSESKFYGEGFAYFTGVQFIGEGVADFSNVKFFSERITDFSKAEFLCEGGTSFREAEFLKVPQFFHAEFSERPDFSDTKILDNPDFNWMEFLENSYCKISLQFGGLKKKIMKNKDQIRKPSIFLCYSSKDKRFVKNLASKLEEHEVEVWLDEKKIYIGDSLTKKIGEAIVDTDYMAAVISNNSINSEWVQKELQIAMNEEIEYKEVIVLPLLIEEIRKKDMPPFLRDKLYADFTSPDKYEKSFKKLLNTLGIETN